MQAPAFVVSKVIPAIRMHQFYEMVDRWMLEGPVRLVTNATITAMDNADLPKAEQEAILQDRDIIIKFNMRIGLLSEVFASAIETAVRSVRSGDDAENEIRRILVGATGARQADESEVITFTFLTQVEADTFDKAAR